ncbi:protein phosphatase inhibitor [Dictyocaulus viviparus]|uniref:E3 ubiquitin-protein ligase PPP1R11 n=1 Tax=Dictyocaulus viviparus TaxID=29172 RepID=A0A0D8XB90_DICVI|nr:protein phosphatase inhibitor [Dictyocaulus viviparus]
METSTSTMLRTEVVTEQHPNETEELVLRLRSAPVPDGPRVTWAADVIDNEHLGRLKSNCCCIYTRPRQWDDPSTWEQDEAETEHCRGHTLPPPRKPSCDKDGIEADDNVKQPQENQCC